MKMSYYCAIMQAVLCAIKKWVEQGGKATLATAPDANILREIVCLLTQQVSGERANFISDENKSWDDQTECMTFEVRKGNKTARSVWTNSVRKAFRRQAGWAKLQEIRATAARHWTERVWYRHNRRWMRAFNEGTEASRSGSFKDGQKWGKKCF